MGKFGEIGGNSWNFGEIQGTPEKFGEFRGKSGTSGEIRRISEKFMELREKTWGTLKKLGEI